MEYSDLFRALSEHKIRYLICGGLAVNIYGIPRMTADIDLLIDFEERNIQSFENVLKQLDYKSYLPLPLSELLSKSKRAYSVYGIGCFFVHGFKNPLFTLT